MPLSVHEIDDYFTGRPLDAEEFTQEQSYTRRRSWLHRGAFLLGSVLVTAVMVRCTTHRRSTPRAASDTLTIRDRPGASPAPAGVDH